MNETGWYVFGIVPAGAAVAAPDVRLVEDGRLAAVAAEVSVHEFDAFVELVDLARLEEKARRHEAVLQSFLGSMPVVPLRFGAVYRNLDAVRRMLSGRRTSFEHTLELVRGHVELGVKAWYDATTVERPRREGGRAYLERRRDELGARRTAAAAVATAHDRLIAHSSASVANPPQPRELTGRAEEMLLNGAYLVREDDEAFVHEFDRLATELRPLGLTLELTGPWPPYNFAEDDAA